MNKTIDLHVHSTCSDGTFTPEQIVDLAVDKGLAAYHEGGRAREYYPLVRKEDVALSETKSLIDRVFKGSVNMMMSALVRSDELSKDEISELQAILKKAGEKAD